MVDIAALPTEIVSLHIYGKCQKVQLQSVDAKARYLNGHPVRAVWSAIYDEKQHRWSPTCLYLASGTDLAASTIVVLYSNRWQQKRTVLERWMQIRSIAWPCCNRSLKPSPRTSP